MAASHAMIKFFDRKTREWTGMLPAENILIRLILTLTLSFSAYFCAPARAFAETAEVIRGVPYITLRNRTGETAPKNFYGDERNELKAGRCDIGETDLSVLSPLAEAAPFYIPEELLRVESIREMPTGAVLDTLEATAAGKAPVLYTHGYYIDFEKGCRRATILQENVDLQGRFMWFSWPSDGTLIDYTRDEADLYWSVPDLVEVLVQMEDRFGAGQVNVAAHSLGGRGMVLALNAIASRHPEVRIGHVALLAPDMDFEIFAKMLPRINPVARSVTVYVTDADRPLALSAQLHGYARLGEAGNDVASLSGVEVIDLSELPVRSPTGHLYHIYDKNVGADLRQLLNEGKRAETRSNLVKIGTNLWSLEPPE